MTSVKRPAKNPRTTTNALSASAIRDQGTNMLSTLGRFALRWEVATADESLELAVGIGAMIGCGEEG